MTKTLTLTEALSLSGNALIVYTLPSVHEYTNPAKPHEEDLLPFILTSFIDEEFYIIDRGLLVLGDLTLFRAGMRSKIVYDELKDFIKIESVRSVAPKTWVRGANYGKVPLMYGQGVLVSAAPESGKSYLTRLLLDSYDSVLGVQTCRILFGERNVDNLGKNTIDCDSSAPLEVQLHTLYWALSTALRDAHKGSDVVIGIDSLTRMIEQLTNMYAHTHLLSGGISASVRDMVGRLFRMTGRVGEGTITIIGTCLWSPANNSWKSIYSNLSAIATAEFHPDIRSGVRDKNRLTETHPKNVYRVLNSEFFY